jgi:nucleotide-binding universal stress UspA family protein
MHDEWGALQRGRSGADEEAGAGDGHRVLVALDGSAHSAAVLPDAVHLATCLGGSLVLAQVMPSRSTNALLHGARARLERLVQSAWAQGVSASTVLLEGNPSEQIVSHALGNGIAAMALGSHGDWGNDGGLSGSVAEAIIRRSPVPILVRRAPAARSQAALPGFQHVLVPLDGSRPAERAVPAALALARASGGRMTLVQVVDAGRPSGDGRGGGLVARELQAASEYLTAVRERFWHLRVPMEVTVRLGHPAEVIRWVVEETAADLVVMATNGRAGLHHERLGSVVFDVWHGDVPLLLIPPAAVTNWGDRPPARPDIFAGHALAV